MPSATRAASLTPASMRKSHISSYFSALRNSGQQPDVWSEVKVIALLRHAQSVLWRQEIQAAVEETFTLKVLRAARLSASSRVQPNIREVTGVWSLSDQDLNAWLAASELEEWKVNRQRGVEGDSADKMSFWGGEVKSGKALPYVPPPESSQLRLTQVTHLLSPSYFVFQHGCQASALMSNLLCIQLHPHVRVLPQSARHFIFAFKWQHGCKYMVSYDANSSMKQKALRSHRTFMMV